MKKILILLLFVPLFSCNDWLTVEPEDSVTTSKMRMNLRLCITVLLPT